MGDNENKHIDDSFNSNEIEIVDSFIKKSIKNNAFASEEDLEKFFKG